jgi:hypothetical protein
VYALDPRAACFEGHWVVDIAEAIFEEVIKEVVKYGAKKVFRYTYYSLLKDSLGTIISGKRAPAPPEVRIEPTLPRSDWGNEPIFDEEAERQRRWDQLRGRATLATPNAFRPVGRSAETLRILTADGEEIGYVDRDAVGRMARDAVLYRQQQIAETLGDLRRQGRLN